MDDVPSAFIEKLLQRGSFASICEATKLSGIYGEIARQFHQRSFNLFVYAKKPRNKNRPFTTRLVPTFSDPWSCCCEKKPEAYRYGTKFPQCVTDHMKYFRSIRVIVDARDVVQVALKPSFLPQLQKLLQIPFARVVADNEELHFFVDIFIGRYYDDLQAIGVFQEMRHLLRSAFIKEQFSELLYRYKTSDCPMSMKELITHPGFKLYIQNSVFGNSFDVVVMETYNAWYGSDNPFHGKYMVNGDDCKIYKEVQKKKEDDCWSRVEHLPVHLIPYTKDARYPSYQVNAEKHYFMRVHPKDPERKMYVALGIYEETRVEYDDLREENPDQYPVEKPFKFCMENCETYFIFYE
uniref:Uncharacterized protein n=1 Tax=Steinernema glaseri TaxID=37863 RepID=A0A1I7XZX5_9BILA